MVKKAKELLCDGSSPRGLTTALSGLWANPGGTAFSRFFRSIWAGMIRCEIILPFCQKSNCKKDGVLNALR